MSQHEDLTGAATRAIFKAKHGGYMSGGRLVNFVHGWALVGSGKCAHYVGTQAGLLRTRCGLVWLHSPRMILFEPGNWPRCKRCEPLVGAS